MNDDPKKILDENAVKEMGAKNEEVEHLLTPEGAKKWWDTATRGKTHKITACMDKIKGHVTDEAAFCGWLAKQVGYKPQR